MRKRWGLFAGRDGLFFSESAFPAYADFAENNPIGDFLKEALATVFWCGALVAYDEHWS